MKNPNILFVITDQMRSTAIGCSGVEKVFTPNIDKLADSGLRFTNAIANSPACTPSRANLMTSKFVFNHGLVNNDMQLGTNFKSFAHCLNDEGYNCGYIGKWHLDNEDRGGFIPPGPRRQGFDDFWAVAECNHNYFKGYYYLNNNPTPVWIDGYEPETQTDLAINYIKEKKKNENPFCLFVSYGPPHCPYEMVPETYKKMYPPEKIELLPNAKKAKVQSKESIGKLPESAKNSSEENDKIKKEKIASYYAQITALDNCFGRLIKSLDDEQLTKNTLIVFTSDHGDMLFSQNRGWKSKPWRESVGIPLILKLSGKIPENKTTDAPISMVDLMPTILSLVGAKVPHDVDGVNLSKFVCGDESVAQDSVFINFPILPSWFSLDEWRGVITKNYTYVSKQKIPWLLYDDKKDPFQLENLINNPLKKNIKEQLDKKLQCWMKKTNDSFPTSKEVADKYCPGHINNIPQAYTNKKITDIQNQNSGIST